MHVYVKRNFKVAIYHLSYSNYILSLLINKIILYLLIIYRKISDDVSATLERGKTLADKMTEAVPQLQEKLLPQSYFRANMKYET